MNVIHMRRQVSVIADQVFPIAGLPDTSLADRTRKAVLDQPPAGGNIMFIVGQRPYGVQMVRQYRPGNGIEIVSVLNVRDGAMEFVNTVHE